jgi:putative OPT family oligopeptide transporter
MVLGGAANWFGAIPFLAAGTDWPTYLPPDAASEVAGAAEGWRQFTAPADQPGLAGEPVPAAEWAWALWSARTRYVGVGAMVVGGLWALVRMRGHLVQGVRSGLRAYRGIRTSGGDHAERGGGASEEDAVPARTERDTPLQWVGVIVALCVVPLFFVFRYITDHTGIALVMAGVMLVAGFLFSAIASYMAGLVGSSNNPVSGVTIATILFSALLLLGLGTDAASGPAAAILIGAVVCCAAAIGGDNMQDLKTGAITGATPWKQQVMQMVGVLAAALAIAPVLTLLLKAYGIGPITVEGQEPLAAPQATLMASVAEGVFQRDLPWGMVWIGVAVAMGVIGLDLWLEKRGAVFRAPVLAVAVGLYLPLELGTAIFVGGLIAWAAHRFHVRREARERGSEANEPGEGARAVRQATERNGLLFAAGLITGEALLGIGLAIPLVLNEGVNPFALLAEPLAWPGPIVLAAVVFLLYRIATRARPSSA